MRVGIYLCASGFPVFYISLFCSETTPANENHNLNIRNINVACNTADNDWFLITCVI